MPAHHAGQPPSLLRDGLMPAALELVLDLRQLRPHPFRDRDTPDPEPPVLRRRADVREAQEVERLRLAQTPRLPIAGRRSRPNSISRVLSGCSSSPNFANRSRSSTRNRCASSSMLETDDEVVRETHDDHITVRVPASSTSRPTGRRRSAGRRSRAAVTPMPPAVTPARSPSSSHPR